MVQDSHPMALALLPRPQSPWATLDRVSLGILGLTHAKREAVCEAVIDLTLTELGKVKSLQWFFLTSGDNLYTIGDGM